MSKSVEHLSKSGPMAYKVLQVMPIAVFTVLHTPAAISLDYKGIDWIPIENSPTLTRLLIKLLLRRTPSDSGFVSARLRHCLVCLALYTSQSDSD